MVYDYFDKYTFMCDMYDKDTDTCIPLVLYFFPYDNSCQVINTKKGKNMLRRVQAPFLKKEMLQIGNTVNIFSKLLLITGAAPVTMRTLFKNSESTFAFIKPISPSMHGKILTFIMKKGFRIVRMKNGKLNKDFALTCYSHMAGSALLPTIIDYVISGEVIGLELVGSDAVRKWRTCLGATNPADAAPGTLRKEYGENILKNIAHGVNTRRDAIDLLELYFGLENGKHRIPSRATCKNCTCCIILPHAVVDVNVGPIIEVIATSEKFYISAMAMFSLLIPNAKEFYEVYDQVLPTYEAMCIQLAEGKCIALEVKCKDPTENVVSEFRKLCGPRDPDLCRQLYPDTIRALYGKTIVQNAVHCTDLPEDGEMEVEYLFKLVVSDKVYDYFDKYTYLCDMYDEHTDTIVSLVLHYFPYDNSCQIINLSKGKVLLRRVIVPSINKEVLQIGNTINIFSKLLLVTYCSPSPTTRTLLKHSESTFALIKPLPANMHGKIITFIMKNGFRIVRMKNAKLEKDFAKQIYSHVAGNKMLPIIIDYVTSGEVVGLELVAPDAVKKWRTCLGATDPADAAPGTLRKEYGENILKNIAHGVNTKPEAVKILEAFFGMENGKSRIPYKATCRNCTCCVILPHAIKEGNMGFIMEHISMSDKFYVSAMAMFSLNIANAQEFYEVYDQVLPTYKEMSIQLAEGKCLTMEVMCKDPNVNVVSEFRKLCGPRDPDLCRQLYPDTIRALYGKTIVQNAVHCTDLPEDGEMEVEYFFKLVASDDVS